MEDENDRRGPENECGRGGHDRSDTSCETAADCCCGSGSSGRPRIRTLIAGSVIFAAIGVGAYSLLAGQKTSSSRQNPASCAPASCAPGKASPAGRSCCPGGSAAPRTAAPCAAKADSAACPAPCGKR